MPVRTTESRLPFGAQPASLGEAVTSENGSCALVSFISSPVPVGRENVYVVFVPDATLAAAVDTFAWTLSEQFGLGADESTNEGELRYSPTATGALTVEVRLLDGSGATLASLALSQQVLSLHPKLESDLAAARDERAPTLGNPAVIRELVNDLNPYYQNLAPQAPEPDDAFKQFVIRTVAEGALRSTPADRTRALDRLAAALNTTDEDFAAAVADPAGVSGIRLPLLAMTVGSPALLDWTELPQPPHQYAFAEHRLRDAVAALTLEAKVDLYNLVRFPKSNIASCAQILEALRDRYFPGTAFNAVVTGLSGTRAHWIARHFREGPLARQE